jgi:glycerol-3-phosphate dehydrogenase
MNRNEMLDRLKETGLWDILIIGGGATGLGAALDAALRGYKTLLLEQSDFARGTSSRSTKLIHGGVRYLKQGNVALVLEALHERGLLMQNAPHLVHAQEFLVPVYDWWEGPFYGVGLKVYDMLAGKLGLGESKRLSKKETLKKIPTLEPGGLRGGVIYCDGQFDDARLAINLAQTCAEAGGTLINYLQATSLLKTAGMVSGVVAREVESGKEYEIYSRVVINATGVFADRIIQMDDEKSAPIIAPSQGIHLVLEKKFLPGNPAIMVPHTDDGRVLFAVPWHDKVVVGTTDTPVETPTLEPRPFDEEIDFILEHAVQYLTEDPTRNDILSVFAGLRPLVREGEGTNTAALSRDHTVMISTSGLVTITGGKWTTYRKMAQDVIDQAALVAGLEKRDCVTANKRIHGWLKNIDPNDPLHVYGSEAIPIKKLISENRDLGEKLHARLPYTRAEVIWGARKEMARTVEDILARRTRTLFLDARASIEMAPEVAKILARELKKNKRWQKEQITEFTELAKGYLCCD